MHGAEGLRDISETAVLNANYLRALLRRRVRPRLRPHRACTSSCSRAGGRRQHGVRTLDIAKRLIDFGIHPPTIYFPLIVEEAIMVEPTEAESQGHARPLRRR